jgi:hypothetical protein
VSKQADTSCDDALREGAGMEKGAGGIKVVSRSLVPGMVGCISLSLGWSQYRCLLSYIYSHANTPCTVQEVPAVNPWTVHDKNDTAISEISTAESLGFQEATSIETARKFPAIKPWVGGGFRRATSL